MGIHRPAEELYRSNADNVIDTRAREEAQIGKPAEAEHGQGCTVRADVRNMGADVLADALEALREPMS
jgi:hypothetical protein